MSHATRRQVADCQASVITATERLGAGCAHATNSSGSAPGRRAAGRGARLARQRG